MPVTRVFHHSLSFDEIQDEKRVNYEYTTLMLARTPMCSEFGQFVFAVSDYISQLLLVARTHIIIDENCHQIITYCEWFSLLHRYKSENVKFHLR